MMNESEKYVADICTKSFLSLWCYANPQGRSSGKELCDFLVICDPDVVIVSVKDIKYHKKMILLLTGKGGKTKRLTHR